MDDTPGQFWCSECQAFYPDTIEATHEASHAIAVNHDDLRGAKIAVFWTGCIAFGAVLGLYVHTLL